MFNSPHLSKLHVHSFPSLHSTPSMPIFRHYLHLQAFVFSFQNTHHAYLHTSHAHSFLTIPSPPLDAHSRPRMAAPNLPRTLPQSRRLPFRRSTHRRSPPARPGGCGCCCCRHHPPICCHILVSFKWRRPRCPSPRQRRRRWGSGGDEREAWDFTWWSVDRKAMEWRHKDVGCWESVGAALFFLSTYPCFLLLAYCFCLGCWQAQGPLAFFETSSHLRPIKGLNLSSHCLKPISSHCPKPISIIIT